MLEGKNIAVIRGGKSAERKISLKTGKAILDALEKEGYDPLDLDPVNNLHKELKEVEVAFIALHGRYGEDGTIQGLLELEEVPYTGSGVLASALAMDKVMSKRIFEQMGINTPKFAVVTSKEMENEESLKKELINKLGLPLVVKPSLEGSSIGLSIINKERDLILAIKDALKHDKQVLIEEYISGREITVGLIGNEDPQVLPIIEIKPKEGIYDFTAKYTKGMTEFVIPASLSKNTYQQAEEFALKAYQALQCRGMSRVDLRVSSKGEAYVLEVNTIPGMTETSLLPQAAEAVGISFEELVVRILEYALE